MIGTATFAGLITALGLIFLAMKFGRGVILTLLGYAWVTDIVVTLGCIALFASSGTISGLMTGIVTGVVASIALSAARKTMGYRTLRVHHPRWYIWSLRWEEHAGEWAAKFRKFTVR